MTTWTARVAPPAGGTSFVVWADGVWADGVWASGVWAETPGIGAVWTERGTAPATELLEGIFFVEKQPSNFYMFIRGKVGAPTIAAKQPSNFYFFAGVYPGSYFLGKGQDNFLKVGTR